MTFDEAVRSDSSVSCSNRRSEAMNTARSASVKPLSIECVAVFNVALRTPVTSREPAECRAAERRTTMHRVRTGLALSAATALLLTGCAVGTGGSAGDDDTEYDPDAELTGELSVMGFSGDVDEVASARVEHAEEQLGDVEVEADRGRPRHPAVPLGRGIRRAARAALRRPRPDRIARRARSHHPARQLHRRRGHRHGPVPRVGRRPGDPRRSGLRHPGVQPECR